MALIRLFCLMTLVCIFTTDEGCSKPNPFPIQGDASIAGQWYVEFNTGDAGYVEPVMTFVQDGTQFEAYSREGAAGDVVGWFKLLLAKIFTHYFTHGALLHFMNGQLVPHPHTNGAKFTATFSSALGDMNVFGTLDDSTFEGNLWDGGLEVGSVWGTRRTRSFPIDDYPALVRRIRTITEEKNIRRVVRAVAGMEKIHRYAYGRC